MFNQNQSQYQNQPQYQNQRQYQNQQQYQNPYQYDDEGGYYSDFDDATVRRKFVCKVYTLLVIQLFISTIIIFTCLLCFRDFFLSPGGFVVTIIAMIAQIAFLLTLTCCGELRKTVPINYILLTFYMLSLGVSVGGICCRYELWMVMVAFGLTTGAFLILTIIASCPCIDITGWWLFLFAASALLGLFGIAVMITSFFVYMPLLHVIYAALGAFLSCVYIIFLTQMILGGRKYSIGPEEYILAAVLLLTEFFNLFMMLLSLINASDNS